MLPLAFGSAPYLPTPLAAPPSATSFAFRLCAPARRPPARPRARPSVSSFVNGQSLEYIGSLWELLGYVLRLLRSYRPRSPDLPGPVRPSPCRSWFTVATPPRPRRRPCLLTYSAPRSPFSTCTSFVHTAAPFLTTYCTLGSGTTRPRPPPPPPLSPWRVFALLALVHTYIHTICRGRL